MASWLKQRMQLWMNIRRVQPENFMQMHMQMSKKLNFCAHIIQLIAAAAAYSGAGRSPFKRPHSAPAV